MSVPSRNRYILTLSCDDRPGIVAAVAKFLRDADCTIVEAAQFGDETTGRFFFRAVFDVIGCGDAGAIDSLCEEFSPVGSTFGMEWALANAAEKPQLVIAVSKFGHCLNDLLYRWRSGALNADICAVVSNHEDMRSMVEGHGIPYHFLPVDKASKAEQEEAFYRLIVDYRADLLVLARYMQVLSDGFCRKMQRRCINIHHSFLPSFKGARPYHAAFDRGVKIVGATAHFVTPDLDEGPIIEQDVIRVSHADAPADLIALGRDVEASVLARAVKWWTEHRVMLNGDKTVVFRR